MTHLIWSAINIIIVLYFFYLLFAFIRKGRRIFNSKFKVLSILVLVIGIVQIISASDSEKNPNRITITEDYSKKNNTDLKQVVLEDNLTFDIQLLVTYSVDENQYIPIESNSFITGLVSGYDWEFKSLKTNAYNLNDKPEYIAEGILKWNLFGINIYNENKLFRGTIE